MKPLEDMTDEELCKYANEIIDEARRKKKIHLLNILNETKNQINKPMKYTKQLALKFKVKKIQKTLDKMGIK